MHYNVLHMAQYELNLRDYWQIIRKRQTVIIAVSLATFFSVFFYTAMQVPLYQASSSVEWMERKTLGSMLTELVVASSNDPLLTQARIINSLPILEKVVIELGTVNKDVPESEISAAALGLQAAVTTEVVRDTNIIRIDVALPVAKDTAEVANEIAEVYVRENILDRNKQNRTVREFIERQLAEIKQKLSESEESVARFKETEAPSGIAMPLEGRLADLEKQHSELLQQYTPLYPVVKNAEEQIKQIKEQLKTLPSKELDYVRLTRETEINSKLYRELKDKLEGARIAEAEKIEEASIVDRAIVPTAPVGQNKALNYFLGIAMGLLLGLSSAFIVEQLDTSIGTIEDVEGYLKTPSLGIIPYLRVKGEKNKNLIEKFFPHKVSYEEKYARLRKQLLVYYSASSPIFEAYRILRTNIQREVFKEEIKGKVLLFASSGPEEGKSITVSNLAIAMAQGGLKTVIVDADMRRSTIHKIFGLKNREPGLSDVLSGTVKIEDALRSFTDILMGDLGFDDVLKVAGLDNLSILTSGASLLSPAELLGSHEMDSLLKSLKNKFDLVLVDSPPVLAVADAVILAPRMDGAILVYRVGKSARSVLGRAKTQLTESGAQVKGVVLNNISPEIEMRYSYYYQNKSYGKYYGEKKEEQKERKK